MPLVEPDWLKWSCDMYNTYTKK